MTQQRKKRFALFTIILGYLIAFFFFIDFYFNDFYPTNNLHYGLISIIITQVLAYFICRLSKQSFEPLFFWPFSLLLNNFFNRLKNKNGKLLFLNNYQKTALLITRVSSVTSWLYLILVLYINNGLSPYLEFIELFLSSLCLFFFIQLIALLTMLYSKARPLDLFFWPVGLLFRAETKM